MEVMGTIGLLAFAMSDAEGPPEELSVLWVTIPDGVYSLCTVNVK
jgi:hypothetical protein